MLSYREIQKLSNEKKAISGITYIGVGADGKTYSWLGTADKGLRLIGLYSSSQNNPPISVLSTYGSTSNIPQIVIDQDNEIISITNIPVSPGFITSELDTGTINLTVAAGVLSGIVVSRSITFSSELQSISTDRILGRDTVGTGSVEELTIGAGLSITGGALVSTLTGLSDGDKGDITVSGTGATWTIDNDVVTFAKMQNVTSARLLGRATAGFGDTEEIILGTGLSYTGTTLNVAGGLGETLAQTLILGNTTGATNIIVSNGNFITGSGGQVQLDFGSDNYFQISTDAGGLSTPYILLDVASDRLILRGTNNYITGLSGGGTQLVTVNNAGLLGTSAIITAYTNEDAQDAVGGALVDSSTVDFTYNDGANTITAVVLEAGLTLDNLGGTLSVSKGGTGATTLTGLLQGTGTTAVTVITNSSTVGQVLRVTGASTYAWGALDLTDGDAYTGALPQSNGGTGSSSAWGAGVLAWVLSATAANLQTAVSGTTGTAGSLVFSGSPTLTTAALGSSTATTQTPLTNNTTLATTAYADALVRSYVLCGSTLGAASTPADATTYFFGSRMVIITTHTITGSVKIFFPQAGTIIAVRVTFIQNAGTTETSSIYLRLNNTTDITISSAVTNDATMTTFIATGLTQAVNASTDYVEFKWITPSWATNPTFCACHYEILVTPT